MVDKNHRKIVCGIQGTCGEWPDKRRIAQYANIDSKMTVPIASNVTDDPKTSSPPLPREVDGKLLVGHDVWRLRPDRSLQNLYLEPLRQRIKVTVHTLGSNEGAD